MSNEICEFNIGHFKCMAIRDGDKNDWDRNILLIDTGQQRALVDTGNGQNLTPKGFLLDRLRSVHISPTEIDVVILSHADWDHIGGTVDENANAIFPQARYVLARAEWDFWSSKPERLRPNTDYDDAVRQYGQQIPELRLAQLKHKLDLIEAGAEIVRGIRSIDAPGHTPGYTVIAVTSDHEQLLFIGDLLYDTQDIENPDWYSVFDFDPARVVQTRRRVFEQAAREGSLLMAYHLPFPGLGYLSQQGSGWHWQSYGNRLM
jgi:glyoxylase-like metal-dependent hydrolase (beta-lactamase superfamily II)